MKSPTSSRKPKKPSITIRRIAGGSMRPGLPPGRIIIAWRRRGMARPGDVVIMLHNNQEIIKRVHAVRQGEIYVLGDDLEHSTDSRSFGWLPAASLIGIVVWPRTARLRKGL